MAHSVEIRSVWTGDVSLGLRNGRGWSIENALVNVHLDHVNVLFDGSSVAVMNRDYFRDWLSAAEPAPLVADDTIWTVQAGDTFVALMRSQHNAFRITPESRAELVAVI